MMIRPPSYHGYRFSPEIISHAVWLYHRFCLSFRDTEDLWDYDVTRDGRFILAEPRPGSTDSPPIRGLVNWMSALTKDAPAR